MHSDLNGRRQAQVGEVGDGVIDAAGDQRQAAALLEQTDAETALVLADDVGKVHAAFLVENLAVLGLQLGNQQPFHVFLSQRPHLHAADVAAHAHHGRLADLEVKVGRLMFHDHAEELVDLRLFARRVFRRRDLGFHRSSTGAAGTDGASRESEGTVLVP